MLDMPNQLTDLNPIARPFVGERTPQRQHQRKMQAVRALRAMIVGAVAVLTLASCGGGGGGSSSSGSSGGGGSTGGGLAASSTYAQQCSPNNPYQADAASTTRLGSLTTEKQWVRSYLDEAYLWYDQVPTVDATAAAYSVDTSAGIAGSLDAYFNALKTPALTASGKKLDQFSFTYPTKAWKDYIGSGTSTDNGIHLHFGSPTPPRNIVVAYVDIGSPADIGGVKRGDVLVSINGISADINTQAGVDALNAALKGASSTTTSYVLQRGSVVLPSVALTPTTIVESPVPVANTLTVGTQKVGYLLFNTFSAASEQALINAVNQFKTNNVSDLVLDLRYNGGGYLYIASGLAYMIAGPGPTTGQTFEKLQYNSKRTTDNAQAPTPFYNQACLLNAAGNCTSTAALPTLNLTRVFVLTSSGTCSASEAVINGLEGVGITVTRIGGTTCGKPYGFTAKDNCGISYFPIEFKGINAKGFGDYADGFAPRCSASDDYTKPLGDATEGQLAAALSYRSSGVCSVGFAGFGSTSPGFLLRGPERESRIVLSPR